jgi:lipid A 3-O-deacylase
VAKRLIWVIAAIAGFSSFFLADAGRADDPDFLSVGGGYFDWNRQKAPAAEFRVEYRSDKKLWIFKPLGGIMATSDGAFYGFAGIGVDVFLGNRFVVTPSFAPGFYNEGSGLDLGHALEFRSQIEFAYRFDDRSRIGLAVSHMSNASIGDTNPGTESAILYYSVPFGKISELFD